MTAPTDVSFRFGLRTLAGVFVFVAALFALAPSHLAIFVVGTLPLAVLLAQLLRQWIKQGRRPPANAYVWVVILALLFYVVCSGPAISVAVWSDGKVGRVILAVYYPVTRVALTSKAGRQFYGSYVSNWAYGTDNQIYIAP